VMGGTSSVLYEIRNKMNIFLTNCIITPNYHYFHFFLLIIETFAKCEEKSSVRLNKEN